MSFAADYKETLKLFQVALKGDGTPFPVRRLKRTNEQPEFETFHRDQVDGDVTYTVEYSFYLNSKDDESVPVKFQLYVEFMYLDIVYTHLRMWVLGKPINSYEEWEKAAVFLSRKDAKAFDELEAWIDSLPEDPD